MRRILSVVLLFALVLGGVYLSPAHGQSTVTVNIDPCFSTTAKSSVPVNVVSVTTTQLVALSGTTSIYVCGFVVGNTGATTATTAQFEYGTGASCGTGTTVLTGALAASLSTSAVVANVPAGGSSQFKAPSGNALCLVSAGTTVSIQGYVTYIQQ